MTKTILTFYIFLFAGSSVATESRFYTVNDFNFPNLVTRTMVQDKQGLLYLGTDSGLLKYDGYKLKTVKLVTAKQEKIHITSIKKLFIGMNEDLWIGTRGQGLYKYSHHETKSFNHVKNMDYITDIIDDKNGGLWISSTKGLNHISRTQSISHYPYKDKSFTSIEFLDLDNLLIGSKSGLMVFNIKTEKYKEITLDNTSKTKLLIYDIHKDVSGKIWIGSEIGLFIKQNGNVYKRYQKDKINCKVISITSENKNIWIGTISKGLFKIFESGKIINFKYNSQNKNSISGNTVLNLYNDNSNNLWISTFKKGLNKINLPSMDFGLENTMNSSVNCADNTSFSSFVEDIDRNLWITNGTRLIKYNYKNRICQKYFLNDGSEVFTSLMIDSDNQLWISTSSGLYTYDEKSNQLIKIKGDIEKLPINFSFKYSQNVLILGTRYGLYKLNTKNNILNQIKVHDIPVDNMRIYGFASNSKNIYYFATEFGLAKLDGDALVINSDIQQQIKTKELLSILIDEKDNYWIGTYKNGLYKFSSSGKPALLNKTFGISNGISINSLIKDKRNNIWIGSDYGLIKYSDEHNTFINFKQSDGLQSDFFNVNANYQAQDGKLIIGGINGFNAFYPNDIRINNTPPNIVLTDFTRFGKIVETGVDKDGFKLNKEINELEKLLLNHKDYVIGFEFAALDYADPSRNKYAYMMQGLDPDWIYVDAGDRKISYSNLKPGDYKFRIKGSNKDGIWNETGKSISITVLSAPWLSWWAYLTYLLLLISIIYYYVQWKNKTNNRINQMLRVEVDKQTKALQEQKQKVENLLAKKNELFANVSHEFRTPLTLILGPINKLIKSPLPREDINALKMVNRNASRLLTMIEQLLQLAKISDMDNIKYYPINVDYHVNMIVTLFEHLADQKKISLQLLSNDKAVINCTKDAVEIVLGNLLSNAIKYTKIGGKITISSCVLDDKIVIKVTDSGCGLDEQQQKYIFNRFKRLESHQNIEGIGIGLSVVEEIIKVNHANISIESEIGHGSCFTVCFNTMDKEIGENDEQNRSLLIKQLTQESDSPQTRSNKPQHTDIRFNETILVIDDNDDMRSHIIDTLKDNYHCIQANRGKKGIALAIEYIPDVVICDVMMPEMDGFQVTRVLRTDTRTSHIPLMLLTALDDRHSRIRGWRENVDVYLTKPFDSQELLIQLENILVIRNILKKKAGLSINAGKKALHTDLPKKDQEFVNNLNQLIAKKFKDPLYQRMKMASDMAVSDRQLQRKLKALIDKNPMDLLREYRLNQAALMLKDGYQVSVTCDACGFNSLPHFSKCFKSQYGLSPKVYQKTCK